MINLNFKLQYIKQHVYNVHIKKYKENWFAYFYYIPTIYVLVGMFYVIREYL